MNSPAASVRTRSESAAIGLAAAGKTMTVAPATETPSASVSRPTRVLSGVAAANAPIDADRAMINPKVPPCFQDRFFIGCPPSNFPNRADLTIRWVTRLKGAYSNSTNVLCQLGRECTAGRIGVTLEQPFGGHCEGARAR